VPRAAARVSADFGGYPGVSARRLKARSGRSGGRGRWITRPVGLIDQPDSKRMSLGSEDLIDEYYDRTRSSLDPRTAVCERVHRTRIGEIDPQGGAASCYSYLPERQCVLHAFADATRGLVSGRAPPTLPSAGGKYRRSLLFGGQGRLIEIRGRRCAERACTQSHSQTEQNMSGLLYWLSVWQREHRRTCSVESLQFFSKLLCNRIIGAISQSARV
jgi:hypothetical protein